MSSTRENLFSTVAQLHCDFLFPFFGRMRQFDGVGEMWAKNGAFAILSVSKRRNKTKLMSGPRQIPVGQFGAHKFLVALDDGSD